eukprot:5114155-Pyramimonas_sp.AAC.1
MRRQQRKARHKRLRAPRAYANPTAFGHLTTMDHWLAMDYLSRGLHGETARVTSMAAQGVHDKSAIH